VPDRSAIQSRPVVIEVRDLHKQFRVPDRRTGIFGRGRHIGGGRELRALRGVSFDVHDGEFFGIVGRNGSGKSTLLKLLASIYRADSGSIRIAGRLAPFIELGVGFNMDLTAPENVTLNGVLNGLGRRESARNLDSILDFAELREFVDLKLKNYSSGMLVRLAFATMVYADADIMLIDEVLAVGDAQFAQKCVDVFRAKRDAGKTLILVTHDMSTVQSFCDRAMLLHHGEQRYLGDPEETAVRYYRLNFGTSDEIAAEPTATVVDAWLADADGERTTTIVEGAPIDLRLTVEAQEELARPSVGFDVVGLDRIPVFGFGRIWDDDEPKPVAAGERLVVSATAQNPLVPGRYTIDATVARDRGRGATVLRAAPLLQFEVVAAPRTSGRALADVGMVSVPADLRITVGSAAA
jgi:ABC-type polysaccharide/polyol phosphate transport system ATPase subunit